MKHVIVWLTAGVLFSCGTSQQPQQNAENLARTTHVAERNLVDTMVLRRQDFQKELISNGRLRALRKSDLRFTTAGQIAQIHVTNGASVSKGQLLAELDRSELQLKLEQAQQRLEKAKIDLADVLIGFGLKNDTMAAPKDKLEIAYIRSGYPGAKSDLKLAKIALENSRLTAPLAGKVANLTAKAHEQAPSDVFCTIIDDAVFEADFNVLESELNFVRLGQQVHVSPFSNIQEVYAGVISERNPMVNDQGQINLRAKITNRSGKLLDGMNVQVVIRERVPKQLIVPKSAVVVRDGFDVLFRMREGKAQWTYVTILASNSQHHIITANKQKNSEINEGDIIITSGNLNLADGSTVEVKP